MENDSTRWEYLNGIIQIISTLKERAYSKIVTAYLIKCRKRGKQEKVWIETWQRNKVSLILYFKISNDLESRRTDLNKVSLDNKKLSRPVWGGKK